MYHWTVYECMYVCIYVYAQVYTYIHIYTQEYLINEWILACFFKPLTILSVLSFLTLQILTECLLSSSAQRWVNLSCYTYRPDGLAYGIIQEAQTIEYKVMYAGLMPYKSTTKVLKGWSFQNQGADTSTQEELGKETRHWRWVWKYA